MQVAAPGPGISHTKGGSGFTETQDLEPFGGRWSHGKGHGPHQELGPWRKGLEQAPEP